MAYLPLGKEGYCNHNVCVPCVCVLSFLVGSEFSESGRVGKLKLGTNDGY